MQIHKFTTIYIFKMNCKSQYTFIHFVCISMSIIIIIEAKSFGKEFIKEMNDSRIIYRVSSDSLFTIKRVLDVWFLAQTL